MVLFLTVLNYSPNNQTPSDTQIFISYFLIFLTFISIPIFRAWTKNTIIPINIEKKWTRILHVNSSPISFIIISICFYTYNVLFELKGNDEKKNEEYYFTLMFYLSLACLILWRIWVMKTKEKFKNNSIT